MTFSYDEADDFDEMDDFDEIDDFEEEPQEPFLEEEDDDPDTALSQAFRQAAAGTIADEDETDEEEDDIEADDGTEAKKDGTEADDGTETDADDPADDKTEEGNDADANTYEQQIMEPVEALPDENEDDLEVELPPLELAPMKPQVEPFRPKEQSNSAYRDARTAYYEENDYQRAIEKFNEAIEYEVQSTEGSLTDANEVVAKSKYWQAEAYVKLQDLPQAIGTFEDLVKTCQGHYLSLAAQRRADQLNSKNS